MILAKSLLLNKEDIVYVSNGFTDDSFINQVSVNAKCLCFIECLKAAEIAQGTNVSYQQRKDG